MGRSAARNQAVQESDADWLFFLDADDYMHPRALENVAPHMHLDAIWGQIMEDHQGCPVARYQVPEIETYQELLEFDPFFTLQMGHFVRADLAKVTPFDELLDTGEDWDYYLRIWQKGACAKVDAPFMINVRGQHSTGPRSATGKEWMTAVGAMIEKARSDVERVNALREAAA